MLFTCTTCTTSWQAGLQRQGIDRVARADYKVDYIHWHGRKSYTMYVHICIYHIMHYLSGL